MSASRGRTRGSLDVAQVDHAQMDLADRRFVVVDQADDRLGVGRVDDDFLVQLAPHAFAVDVLDVAGRGVDRRNVPADADAPLGVQPAFALAAAALVFEQVDRAVGIGPAEEHVRNELLEAGVLFHLAARQVLDVAAFQEPRQVASHFGREALKVTQLVEQRGGNDENFFRGDNAHRRDMSSEWSRIRCTNSACSNDSKDFPRAD